MSLLNKDVHVSINLSETVVKRMSFGMPLILTVASSEIDYKEYTNLTDLAVDYASTTDAYKMADVIWKQDNSPEKIAVVAASTDSELVTKLADADVYYNDWYFLLATTSTTATVTSIANKVEELGGKMFVTRTSSDTEMASYAQAAWKRTVCFYTTSDLLSAGEFPDAALVGACGSKDVGSITWKAQTLKGVTPLFLTPTELKAIHNNNCLAYITKAGDDVTSEGKVISGEYIDVMHSQDYIVNQIEYNVQKMINKQEKIPYTNAGIAMIEAVNLEVLQDAYTAGMISDTDGTPDYTTSYGTVDQVSEEDKKARQYKLGTFSFKLSGAIHEAWITGTITL